MNELAVYNQNTASELDKKYLIFTVGKESYGIDVACINNIIQMPRITNVPNAPRSFMGIINLRGQIIPVMSLHRRMNAGIGSTSNNSKIIILNLSEDRLMGVIVDDVKEVITISEEDLENPTPFLKQEESIIKAVAKREDDLISVLEVEMLLEQDNGLQLA